MLDLLFTRYSHSRRFHIYIYICVCVCVCVCIYIYKKNEGRSKFGKQNKIEITEDTISITQYDNNPVKINTLIGNKSASGV